MSNLDSDFDTVAKDVEDKVRQAEKLLLEASKLAADSNLSIDKGDVDNLFNIVSALPVANWEESEYDDTGWQSSSSECW
jgi:hypothetical protein